MSEDAVVTQRAPISRIWIVPIVAMLLGIWMVVYTWQQQGPEVTIVFSTAAGIEEGKTKIRARNVEVGLVQEVRLSDDYESVVVTAQLDLDARPLLREDSQFWVVRARIGAAGITGLGTLLSGGYIELAPGVGKKGVREFVGLDDPPVTPAGTPGLAVRLWSNEAGSVGVGNPILYRGFRVGRIESADFDIVSGQMMYQGFIQAPYDELVNSATRFWDTSGISFSASADGFELQTGTLETLLVGGIAFGLPDGVLPGHPVEHGATFRLHPDREHIGAQPFLHYVEYVVEFDRSVRGLTAGAPVTYRGLRAGHVERIMLEELADAAAGDARPIPVLIRLEPGRMMFGDDAPGEVRLQQAVEGIVDEGLRASLATGNLLTGSLYVALEIFPDAEPDALGRYAGRPTIPTIGTGLDALQQKVGRLLDKLNGLPLDDITRRAGTTLASTNRTLQELEGTVAELRELLASDGVRALPASLEGSLAELDRTLRSARQLMATLERQPNTLVFPRQHTPDPQPAAGTR